MNKVDIQFDKVKLRGMILSNFKTYADFCKMRKISKSTLNGWLNKGPEYKPRGESWDKIIKTFAKKGVTVTVSDLFSANTSENRMKTNTKEDTELKVSENKSSYEAKKENDSTSINQLIAEKNQIIVEQYQEILSLRKEIETLKKRRKRT